MNEQLIVKNFGPIKDATVDFKKVTVFIGPTGGGKSTLAKLAAIFRDKDIRLEGKGKDDIFSTFSLANYFNEKTEIILNHSIGKIEYEPGEKSIQVYYNNSDSDKIDHMLQQVKELNEQVNSAFEIIKALPATSLERSKLLKENDVKIQAATSVLEIYNRTVAPSAPQYIPSERIFLSSIEYSWAGLIKDNIGLPKVLLDFANNFSLAIKRISILDIDFLRASYMHVDGKNYIKTQQENKILRLSETASGIQSVTPMLVLLEHLSRQKEQAQSFIIEEPELNLYPTAQQGLLNWLVEKCTAGENDLTITTHSPYILASCNLLMEAYKVWQDRPELEAEIEKIVPRASWINPDEFAAYYVADGTVRSIQDERTDLIGGNELDAVSGNISDAFRSLLRLKKQPA